MPPPRAGEHQGLEVAAGRELAADGLDDHRGQGHRTDAGVALGSRLEAAAEAAGLVADVDHLDHRRGAVEVDAAAAQSRELAEPQASAKQGEDMVPPEQGEAGEQLASFLGSERSASGLAEHFLGVGAALGHRDLADRVGVESSLVDGVLEDAQQ